MCGFNSQQSMKVQQHNVEMFYPIMIQQLLVTHEDEWSFCNNFQCLISIASDIFPTSHSALLGSGI